MDAFTIGLVYRQLVHRTTCFLRRLVFTGNMEGIITSFRQGRHTQYDKQMIVEVDGVDSRDEAEELVGKDVSYNTGTKTIDGEVTSAHGNNGAVRVLFEKGMPGQSLAETVSIS